MIELCAKYISLYTHLVFRAVVLTTIPQVHATLLQIALLPFTQSTTELNFQGLKIAFKVSVMWFFRIFVIYIRYGDFSNLLRFTSKIFALWGRLVWFLTWRLVLSQWKHVTISLKLVWNYHGVQNNPHLFKCTMLL